MLDMKGLDQSECGAVTSSFQSEHFIIAKNTSRHLAFPDVCQLRSKELLVVYRDGAKHVDSSGRIMLVRGRGMGSELQFQEPEVVCDTDWDDRDPSIVELSNGTILINFFRLNLETGQIDLCLISSSDSGQSWGSIQSITFSGFSEGLACSDAVVELPTGDLVMAVYGKADTGSSGSYLIRSSDFGLTWPFITPLAVSTVPIFEEPAITYLESGRLVSLLRTDNTGWGNLYQVVSDDEGHTWSRPERLDLWGYPADLLVLQDGRLLGTYGYRQLPTGVRYCLSNEDLSWSVFDEQILRADGHDGGELGYPSSVELEPGKILTIYYYTERGGSGMPFIAGTQYDLQPSKRMTL